MKADRFPQDRFPFLRTLSLASLTACVLGLAACSGQSSDDPPATVTEQQAPAGNQTATKASSLVNEPFSEARFNALNQGDGLVLVDVSATWCPTCRGQKQVLAKFQQQHPDIALTVLNVDFDEQKQWVKHFKAPRQSTLALYRNGEQVWFSVAEQRERIIFEALLKAAGEPA